MAGNIKGITIQLGADTTKLSSALSKADKAIKTTQTQLSKVDKALHFEPGNTDLLRDKFALMSERISETKTKLDTLKEAQRQLDAAGVDKNSEQYQALQIEIDTTKSKLKGLEDQMDDFGSVGAQKIKAMGEEVAEAGNKIGTVGDAMTKGVTVPIVAAGAASVAAWTEVDAAMDTVAIKTGATGDTLAELQQNVTNIAESIPTSFENAGVAIGEVNTRFGLTGQALEDLSTQFIQFAEMNNTDLNSSIDTVQNALNAFGLSADDAGAMLDTMNKVGQDTGISMDTLSQLMVSNATAFQGLGLNAADAANLLGTLEKSGIDTSVVMTGLSKVQKTAMEDGVSMEQSLSQALTSSDAAISTFGAKAGPKLYAAFQNGTLSVEDFTQSSHSLEDALGSVSGTYEETLDPLDQLTTSMNTMKSVGADIVNSSAPMLADIMTKVGEAVKRVSDGWNSLSEEQKQMVVKIALIVAAVGPLLTIISKVVGVVSTIMTLAPAIGTALTVLTGPIGLVVAAVAAVIAIGVAVVKNWDTIKAKAGEIGAALSEKWSAAKEAVVGKVTEMKEGISEKWNGIKNDIANSAIGQTVGTVWQAAKDTMSEKLGNMKQAYDEHGGGLKGAVAATMEGIKGYYSAGYTFLDNVTGGKLSNMASTVSTKMTEVKGHFQTKLDEAKTSVSTKLETMKTTFSTGMGSMASKVSEKMAEIKKSFTDKIQEAHDVVSGVIEKIKKLFDITLKLDIKLPHVSVSGGSAPYGIGGKGSLPSFSVDWYDKGGIFDHPSIIGVGEKRPEFVGALDDLRAIVREESGFGSTNALLAQMVELMSDLVDQGGRPITVNQTINAQETSYAGQQKQAAREFKNMARALT